MKWSDFDQAERWKVTWGVFWRYFLIIFAIYLIVSALDSGQI